MAAARANGLEELAARKMEHVHKVEQQNVVMELGE